MTTWHQERPGKPLNGVLWHPTKWTVVYPGRMLTVSRFETSKEAYDEMAKNQGAYVINPILTKV